ncbi:MAG: GGDEF domain-containing protein [Thermodesulfobacteriota bacterium]
MTNRPGTVKIPTIIIHDGNEQAVRIRRLIIAFSGYVLAFFCVAFPAHLLGFTRDLNWAAIFLFQVLPFVAFYICLFILMHTGINRRFRDPGLIFIQQFVGIIITTVVCYYAIDSIRGACLILYIHIFYFGAFHHRPRGFVFLLLETVVLYTVLIVLLHRYHPAAIVIKTEVMRLIILMTALVWTAVMGNYLELLRSKIRQLAIRDELTGTLNRRELFKMLSREKSLADRSGIPFSVCMLDLDDFKGVNDTYGHQVGDQVLREFAQTVKENIRAEDYLGRYGGEEFLVVFANFAYREDSGDNRCVDRLREVTETLSFPEIAPDFRLTVSIGVSAYQAGDTIDALVARADAALYDAKRNGKNRVVFRA